MPRPVSRKGAIVVHGTGKAEPFRMEERRRPLLEGIERAVLFPDDPKHGAKAIVPKEFDLPSRSTISDSTYRKMLEKKEAGLRHLAVWLEGQRGEARLEKEPAYRTDAGDLADRSLRLRLREASLSGEDLTILAQLGSHGSPDIRQRAAMMLGAVVLEDELFGTGLRLKALSILIAASGSSQEALGQLRDGLGLWSDEASKMSALLKADKKAYKRIRGRRFWTDFSVFTVSGFFLGMLPGLPDTAPMWLFPLGMAVGTLAGMVLGSVKHLLWEEIMYRRLPAHNGRMLSNHLMSVDEGLKRLEERARPKALPPAPEGFKKSY